MNRRSIYNCEFTRAIDGNDKVISAGRLSLGEASTISKNLL